MKTESLLLRGFVKEKVELDDCTYTTLKRQSAIESADVPRLVIVSYLPEQKTIKVLQLCIATIKKFTDTAYELWVVDNKSPLQNLEWLVDEPNVNLIFNRSEPKEKNGSYGNAIGLELASNSISQDTQYFMTLHQDCAPCKKGWLSYLMSKFDDKTRAVGVREDTFRIKEGILHVLGYMIDYQIFRKNQLSFFPELPSFDVGDKAIHQLGVQGYKYWAAPNTLWNPELVAKIVNGDLFKDLPVDRSLNDDNEVFFLHLGRGVLKSQGDYEDASKSLAVWANFINQNLLSIIEDAPARLKEITHRVQSDLWYSFRRYCVDKFFLDKINHFMVNDKVIDIGGVKENKRGGFDINQYPLEIVYANIDEQSQPDIVCDLTQIPVPNDSFDGVILGEVLEHVSEPKKALLEAYRILKPGGKALITTPFMYHIHAHPNDYLRYTDYWYSETLNDIGFCNIEISKQGGFPSVLANILKSWAYELRNSDSYSNLVKRIFQYVALWFSRRAIKMEGKNFYKDNWKMSGHTTGFGVVCCK